MKNRFILSVLVPVMILLAMTVQPITTSLYGTEIKIKTQPVDPTDLFRGDYVTLNYEINQLKLEQFPELAPLQADIGDYEKQRKYLNQTVYVTLKKQQDIYRADQASFQQPTSGLYLKGKIKYFLQEQPPQPEVDTVKAEPVKKPEEYRPDSVWIDYQLDKYFVPENTGTKLEELSRQGQLVATIKVQNGYALLVDITKAK